MNTFVISLRMYFFWYCFAPHSGVLHTSNSLQHVHNDIFNCDCGIWRADRWRAMKRKNWLTIIFGIERDSELLLQLCKMLNLTRNIRIILKINLTFVFRETFDYYSWSHIELALVMACKYMLCCKRLQNNKLVNNIGSLHLSMSRDLDRGNYFFWLKCKIKPNKNSVGNMGSADPPVPLPARCIRGSRNGYIGAWLSVGRIWSRRSRWRRIRRVENGGRAYGWTKNWWWSWGTFWECRLSGARPFLERFGSTFR